MDPNRTDFNRSPREFLVRQKIPAENKTKAERERSDRDDLHQRFIPFYICSSNGMEVDRRSKTTRFIPVRNSILELGKAKYNQEVSVGSDLRVFSSPCGPGTRINHVQVGLSPWQKFRPRYCISPEGTCARGCEGRRISKWRWRREGCRWDACSAKFVQLERVGRASREQQAERLAALPCSKSLEIYLREIYKSKKESKESLFPRVSRESFLRGRDFFSGKFFGTMVFFFLK